MVVLWFIIIFSIFPLAILLLLDDSMITGGAWLAVGVILLTFYYKALRKKRWSVFIDSIFS